MSEPFKTYSAVFPLILNTDEQGTKILLHRRQNTGYQDGRWDIAGSGHVDEGETAKAAVIRECREEIGIEVEYHDVTFVHLSHRLSPDRIYYDIYFVIDRYAGTPTIMEPEKCSDLSWLDIDNLPGDIIDCRKTVIREFRNKSYYSEIVDR